jgi:hypothetical protein
MRAGRNIGVNDDCDVMFVLSRNQLFSKKYKFSVFLFTEIWNVFLSVNGANKFEPQ